MSDVLLKVVVGVVIAVGIGFCIRDSPLVRRAGLSDRLSPYIRERPRVSRLLSDPTAPVSLLAVVAQILGPLVNRAALVIEQIVGGSRSVRKRLIALGSATRVEELRIEQAVWGFLSGIAGILLAILFSVIAASVNLLAVVLFAGVGVLAGVLGRDWWLSVQVRRREQAMMVELPVVAELLALAVTAGESPVAALERVCRLCKGELSRELASTLAEARAGVPLAVALESLAQRTTLGALIRFVDGIVIALERGTPLADVLRAQATDVREAGRRELLVSGGRREILMMMPVVFLILPVTVLFALYPGLVNITLLSE